MSTVDVHRMTAAWDASSGSGQMDFDLTVLDSHTADLGPSTTRWMTWDVTDTAVRR